MESRGEATITKQIAGKRIDSQIVDALEEATGRRPVDVPPLYNSVDLESLASIVMDDSADVEVEFEHVGCTVQVADGTITVTPE